MSDKKEGVSKEQMTEAEALAKVLEKGNVKGGILKLTCPKDVYEKEVLAPLDLTEKTVKALHKKEAEFAEKMGLAVGLVTNESRKEDDTIVSSTMAIRAGNNSITYAYTPVRGEGEDRQFGNLDVSYKVQATESKAGMTAVKKSLAEQAAKMFG